MRRSLLLIGLTSLLAAALATAQSPDLGEICSRIAREAASYSCTTNRAGNHTTIAINSSGIIEWQDFRVPEDHTLEFRFQDPSQWVLNEVVSPARSFILGNVIAHGKFALINPNAAIDIRAEIQATETLLSTANLSAGTVFSRTAPLTFNNLGAGAHKIVIDDKGALVATEGDLILIAGGTLGNDGHLEAARSLRLTTFGDATYNPGREDALLSSGERGFSFVNRGALRAGTRYRKGIIEIDVSAMTLNGSIDGPRDGLILVQAGSIRNEGNARYRGPAVSRVFIQAKSIKGPLGFQQDDGANPSRLPSLTMLSRGRGGIRRLQPMNPAQSVSARPLLDPSKDPKVGRKALLARSTQRFSQVYRRAPGRGTPTSAPREAAKPKRR